MSDANIRGAGPPFSATSPEPKSATLPAELREFLVELGIALQKHGIYPRGHPSLIPAAEGIVTRLKSLLGERAELSIGVGRYQLVLEGVATDAKHPMLRELAGRLHRHLLGAVSLRRGLEAEELAQVLRFLAAGGDPPGEPVGLLPWERLNPWPHVRLHPVTYERLDLIEGKPGAGAGGGASRAAQLWLDLARAAMARRDTDESPPDSERVAQAINEHPAATAYDQAVIANLLQIAETLKAAQGADAVALRGRVSQLVTKLKPETLTRLLDMGGDRTQRRKFLLDSTEGLGVDAVLRLVDAAAVSSRQTISDSLLRLLSKLAVQADRGAAAARVVADTAVRTQVTRLIENWTLDDPNPEAYSAGLAALSRSARADGDKALRGPLAS
ncbi:MAG: hypothetical protein HY701_02135, partial [Gemmatimonadetes bacterium]|nr:hypothetical protein [Gemmatimonadota bacterium]